VEIRLNNKGKLKMLKKLICLSAGVMFFNNTPAFSLQTKVTSGSKYPVSVMVFEGTCNPNQSTLDKIAEESKKKGMLSKLKGTLQATLEGQGCENVGQTVTLTNGQSIDVSEGEVIVAFKDPIEAYQKYKKVVNPLPAVCKISRGKTVTLVTRKSEGLRSVFGMAGDGGLKCETKK
jgi:hypothetical protein